MGIFFDLGRKKQSLKVSHLDADCRIRASRHLAGVFQEIRPERDIIFFCIGTDRSTGDSLGPLVGTQLIKKNLPAERVYGTLDRPVHAINLDETLSEAVLRHRDPLSWRLMPAWGSFPVSVASRLPAAR